jgi:hypothetical protein
VTAAHQRSDVWDATASAADYLCADGRDLAVNGDPGERHFAAESGRDGGGWLLGDVNTVLGKK